MGLFVLLQVKNIQNFQVFYCSQIPTAFSGIIVSYAKLCLLWFNCERVFSRSCLFATLKIVCELFVMSLCIVKTKHDKNNIFGDLS